MSEKILYQFGSAVRKLRRERDISQERLADMCCLHRTYISDVELGKRNISLENIAKMASAFGISIAELFIEVEKNHESIF